MRRKEAKCSGLWQEPKDESSKTHYAKYHGFGAKMIAFG